MGRCVSAVVVVACGVAGGVACDAEGDNGVLTTCSHNLSKEVGETRQGYGVALVRWGLQYPQWGDDERG